MHDEELDEAYLDKSQEPDFLEFCENLAAMAQALDSQVKEVTQIINALPDSMVVKLDTVDKMTRFFAIELDAMVLAVEIVRGTLGLNKNKKVH